MKKGPFKLRNRRRDVESDLSERELLKRIQAGKLNGDEEISSPPYEQWWKISSHPVFYDAFLQRLFAKEYRPPGSATPDPSEIPASGRTDRSFAIDPATRQAEASSAASDKASDSDDAGKTRRIAAGPGTAAGTVHQSWIDELFSQSEAERPRGESEYPAPEEPGANTALVKVEPVANESTVPFEAQALSQSLRGEVPKEAPAADTKVKQSQDATRLRRRLILYGAALSVLLYFLFSMGGKEAKSPPLAESISPSGSAKLPALAPANVKQAKLAALVREADGLYAYDDRLFLEGALDVLREAQGMEGAGAAVLGKLALVAARLLPEAPNRAALSEEIRVSLQRARLVDPHLSLLYRAEALALVNEGKAPEAKNAIISAIESDPTNAENAVALGEINLALNDVPAAKTALEEALRISPNSIRAHYLLGKIALEQSDARTARTRAVEALRLNPLHVPSYAILAEVSASENQLRDARQFFETAGRLARLTTKEVAARAYFRLGKLHEISGNKNEAELSYRLAYRYLPKLDPSLAEKVKGLELSQASLEELAVSMEHGSSYFEEQGEGLVTAGKSQEAIRFFQAAALLNPKQGASLIRLGEVFERLAVSYEDFRHVMNLYERAIDKDPSEARGYVKLGLIEAEQYNWERAYKLLKQAVALAPESAEPYVALGKYYFKRQDYSEALNQFVEAKKHSPGDSEILYYAGKIRLVIKKDAIRDAMPFFYQAYTLDPQNYEALAEWLKLKVLSYEKNFAIKFVRNSLEKEPNNAKLYWVMGEVFLANNEARRAITYYHKSLDIDNRDSRTRMSLASALQAVGELDKAVAEYRLASLLDRRNSDGFYKAADLLFQMRNYNQAEEVLKFLVTVTPNYPGAHRYLAKIYGIRRQKDLAIAAMQKEAENNPENYKFIIELAELYMEYEMFDKAISELVKVTNLPPVTKSPEFFQDKVRGYLLLSRCYRAQNKADSAEASIKLALDLDPNDPELHRELGYVYYALQRDKEGVRAFEYYLSRNPAARDVEIIKGLIQKMMIEE